jgi:hypothetical protein
MRRLLTLCAVMLLCIAACLAQCTTIAGGPIPATYLSSTNQCAIGTETVGDYTTHCFGPSGDAAEFGVPVEELLVGDGWSAWNSPPYAETATPYVGFTVSPTNQINLTSPATTMGVEIEPNAYRTSGIVATFYDGLGNVLATVTQHISGDAGSMLFAAMCPTATIHSVVITSALVTEGFAFAHVRASSIAASPVSAAKPSAPPAPVPPGTTRNH